MTGTLAHALAWIRRGHEVLPLTWPVKAGGRLICSCPRRRDCRHPCKHPHGKLVPRGLLDASTDPGVVRHWFETAAPDANLGLRTEKLIVLDADPRHGGDEGLAALEREHGELPPTWRALTGGGGEHVLFACPEGVTVRSSQADTNPRLGPGIDVRAQSGYVVAPPSRHVSGRVYAWSVDHHPADVALAEPPGWLLDRLAERTSNRGEPAVPRETWEKLTSRDGIRQYGDAAATQVAGHLLRRWVDPYLVAGLLHAWNQTYLAPPLPDDELRRILDRVARREDQRRDAAASGEGGGDGTA